MLGTASNLRLVGEASSGTDALKAIDALKPDLILMDVHMPEMDGPATAKAPKHCGEEMEPQLAGY